MKRLLKNFSYTISSNLLALLISVFVTLVVPKLLGVTKYSYWQLYVFFTAYVGIFPFGWTDGIYLKIGGKKYNDLNKVVLHGQFVMYSIYQCLIAIVIASIVMNVNFDTNKMIVIEMCAICLILYNIRAFMLIVLQSTNRIKNYSSITIEDRIIYLCLLIFFLGIGVKNFEILILSDLFAKFITMLHAGYVCRDITLNSKLKISFRETLDNINVGIKLLVANFAGLLIIGVIRFAIQKFWSIQTFGKISLTLSISSMLISFISAISLVLFPALRRIPVKSLNNVYVNVRNAVVIMLSFSLFLYFPLRLILPIWLPQYQSSMVYLSLLFPICFFEGKFELLTNTFMKTVRMERTLLFLNLTTLSMSLLLTGINVYFLHNINLIVLTIVFVLGFRSTLGEIIISQRFNVRFFNDIVVELTMAFLFILFTWNLTLILSLGLYFLIFIAMVCFKFKDIKDMYYVVKKSLM